MEITAMKSNSVEVMKSKKGGLRTMPFIIANETLEKVANVGLQANMILYLMKEYHLSSATGATVLLLWSAISHFIPIIGAFLADSYLGRFVVISLGTFITLLGMTNLWLTAIIPEFRPPHCKMYIEKCLSPTKPQLSILFFAFALMAIGAGGIRACSLPFGADQFNNPNNPKNQRVLQSFFNWYYASVGISIMISVTLIVYIQDKAGWIVGFGVPVGLLSLSTVLFLLGSSLYIKVNADKSLFTGFAQAASAAWKKRHSALPPIDSDSDHKLYYHKGSIKLLTPTQKLRCLNKACMITNPDKELDCEGKAIEPWNLCTVKQVEELKALIKVLPLWTTGITIAVTLSQHSFPVLQAQTMDRHISSSSHFKIPAGSFGVFAILSLTIWVATYDRIIVPLLSKFTKNRKGLSLKQRLGLGLAISCMAMAVSALVERKRRITAIREGFEDNPGGVVSMSAMWLVPQYCLIGVAEAFNAIGQIELYYSQFPKSMSSIGVALFSFGMGVGNLIGILVVAVINGVTKRGGKPSWLSSNLNKGHYDYYYWLLCFLSIVNFFYFLACSWAYGSCEDSMEEEDVQEALSPENHEIPQPIASTSLTLYSPVHL